MKKLGFNLIAILLLHSIGATAQELPLAWQNSIQPIKVVVGGVFPSYDVTDAVKDANGDTYLVGHFRGTCDFDPSDAEVTLVSLNPNQFDAFIAKYTEEGNLIYAKAMRGNNDKRGLSIGLSSDGKVIVGGYFIGSTNFDPGITNFSLTSAGVQDAFLARFNAASGNFENAVRIGGTGADQITKISIDGTTLYVTGTFIQTVDFDPGAGTVERTSDLYTSRFLAQYSTNFAFNWVQTFLSPSLGLIQAYPGGVYVAGTFGGSADVDIGNGTLIKTSAGSTDVWLSKLASDGSLVWNQTFGGSGNTIITDLATNASQHIFISGYFTGTTDFNPGAGVLNLTSNGADDGYVSRFDQNGAHQWTRSWGGTGIDYANSLAVLQNDQVVVTGLFRSPTFDADPGVGTFNLTNADTGPPFQDAYQILLNNAGNFLHAFSYGATGINETAYKVRSDNNLLYSVIGVFTKPVDFDPATDTNGLPEESGLQQIYMSSYTLLGSIPPNQPTVLNFSGNTSNSINGSFTAAAGATGYIVVRRANQTPQGLPKDGKSYSVGNVINDAVVVYFGASTSFADNFLAENSSYFYSVYAYTLVGNKGFNYRTITPLTGNSITLTLTPSRTTDSLALVAFYQNTDGANWTDNSNWLSGNPIDTWYGVTLNGNQRVSQLILFESNLNGTIVPQIGNLSELEILNLGLNSLVGQIPAEVGKLSLLISLGLNHNNLDGHIPSEISNLSNLAQINLSHNLLNGPIPPVIGNLTGLNILNLSENKLTGSIPVELASLAFLDHLMLGWNLLSGTIPAEFGNSNIQFLVLADNKLSGSIPPELGNNSNLINLNLDRNQLTGTIPTTLGNLPSLQTLSVAVNQLTGSLPSELGNLSSLTYLNVTGNGFSGTLPPSLGNLSALEYLYLSANQFEGSIPVSFTNLSSLLQLAIQTNQFDTLPDFSGLPNLQYITAANNRFTFEDLEPNISKMPGSFYYSPQAVISNNQSITLNAGQPFNPNFTVEGTANLYQWQKNAVNIGGATSDNYNIPSLVSSDVGTYVLRITNNLVPGLTLSTGNISLTVKDEGLFEWAEVPGLTDIGFDTTPGLYQFYSGQWGDFNNDGFDDLYVIGFSSITRGLLYKNNGDGTFTTLPDNAYFFSNGRSVTWADYNNDGLLDCFAPSFTGDSVTVAAIFKNNGNETFTRIPLTIIASGGTWADTDNDGDLDLIINGGTSPNEISIYRNDGNDVFTRIFVLPGATINQWNPIAVDINGDNLPDVYNPSDLQRTLHVATGPNAYALNNSTPLITDPLTTARGISWADIDNDGDLDAYVTANTIGNRFYFNDGAGNFTSQTTLTVLGETIFGGRLSVFFDYDNDGYLDLLTYANVNPANIHLYRNNGNSTFTRVTNQSFKFGGGTLSGASVADYDNDGFLDIFSASFGLENNGLYRNLGNANNWLQLKLEGKITNRSAIGAKIDVYAGGLRRHHQVIATNGQHNQNSLTAHFGLGGNTSADSITIRWPWGYKQTLLNVSANQKLFIREAAYEADSIALVALYNATAGDNWANKTNWNTNPVTSWFGATFQSGELRQLNLPNNNLTGTLPDEMGNFQNLRTLNLSGNNLSGAVPPTITNLTNLQVLNLSTNKIDSLPVMTSMTSLTSVNVSNNNLDFASLEANASLGVIDYQIQAPVTPPLDLGIPVGSDFELSVTVGGTTNQYQWKRNGANVDDATNSSYTISTIGRSNMGDYICEITNTQVPGLLLTSSNQRVLATATISGTLFAEPDLPATDGYVSLFRITPVGAYDTTRVLEIENNGSFLFEEIVLDDYILLGFADTLVHENSIPTWYEKTILWEEADTIFLNDNLVGIDFVSEVQPTEPLNGPGELTGILEEELPGGRTKVRGRVSSAGVAVRRVERAGRPKDDEYILVAYTFTDAEGAFAVRGLDEGLYRLNIQYPGFPMDEDSFIEFTIGQGLRETKINVEALVFEGKIRVRQLIITGIEGNEGYTMSVYPNPVSDKLTLEFAKESKSRDVTILDNSGRKISTTPALEKEVVISVRDLPEGNYIINVREGNKKVKTARLVIQD